ncbi:response regulator [Sphingomonas sp. IC-56]|uniref:response regulator n=1 Tax=Sphingomonas sp. IC-56 TaxID=2898529 RepID=UPI001E3A2F6D|nr:response regulator [Sphingomonas sp. IC-56]MCD2323348.1 response regulator [Sphingomonas sp. IC-56]
MVERALDGMRILVVEDEYLLADDLRDALTEAGAQVLGPVPSVDDAQALIAREAEIDAAVLDINLRGEMVFPVADVLAKRGVPFAFATGYDEWALPERFAGAPRVEKPLKGARVMALLGPMLEASEQA